MILVGGLGAWGYARVPKPFQLMSYLSFFGDSEPPSLPPSLPLSPCSSPRSSSEPIPPEPFSWAPSSASSSAESFSDPGYAFDNSPIPLPRRLPPAPPQEPPTLFWVADFLDSTLPWLPRFARRAILDCLFYTPGMQWKPPWRYPPR